MLSDIAIILYYHHISRASSQEKSHEGSIKKINALLN